MRRIAYLAILILSLSVLSAPISSAEEGDISRAYDSLTESQQKAYNTLDSAVTESRTSASIGYLTFEEAEVVRDAYDCDHPEVFWFDECFTLWYYKDTGIASDFRYTAAVSEEEIQKDPGHRREAENAGGGHKCQRVQTGQKDSRLAGDQYHLHLRCTP